jgi:uncharacterized protein YerC
MIDQLKSNAMDMLFEAILKLETMTSATLFLTTFARSMSCNRLRSGWKSQPCL